MTGAFGAAVASWWATWIDTATGRSFYLMLDCKSASRFIGSFAPLFMARHSADKKCVTITVCGPIIAPAI